MYKKEKDRYNQYRVGKSIVNDYSKNSNIKTGDIIKVVGKNKPLSNMKFEDFYYGRYLKSTGIENYCNMYKYKKIGINKKYELIGNIRRYIRETNRYLYKDKSDFLNSMLIGEKELIKDEDKRMFSRTGISHIIAISGLHVSILCAFIGFLGRRINITFNMIILNLVLYLYIYIAGGSPSIIRAVLSSVFSNIAFFIDRRKDGVTTLMIIASAMIIYNPFILYNISFQLSFLATFSIVYFYPIINKKIKLSIVSITIAANIMTMPIIIYNFKGISLLSLISNIMVVPFISLVIYLDIISLVIFNLFPFISVLISLFNSSIISYIHFILEKIDEIWFSYIRFTQLDFSFLIIYYIIISLGIIYYEIKVVEEQRNELQGYYRGNERK
ncbi:ComEC/Rec2 family competence protein [Peptacetobacter sp.]|nr:ComEC/Rec2 family competence protein [Peptacetobacter sp.]